MQDKVQTKQDVMSTEDTLLAYSEWLDGQGLIVPDREGYTKDDLAKHDGRSHEQLARDFVKHWESNPHRATLAGRLGARFLAAVQEAGQKMLDALNDAQS